MHLRMHRRVIATALATMIATTGLSLLTDTAARAESGSGVISSVGPLTKIKTTHDLNCYVDHRADVRSEFFGGTGCATLIAVGGTTFGPGDVPSGPHDPGTLKYKKFTTVSQSQVTGAGTVANPYKVTTVVDAGTTKIRLTQVDTYVEGQDTYRTDIAVANRGLSSSSVILYRAGNCFLAGDDRGTGRVDSATGSVSCAAANGRTMQWQPLSAGSKYREGTPSSVWAAPVNRVAYANTCDCTTFADNAAGLSWSFSVGLGATVTKSLKLNFSPVEVQPLTTSKTADASTAEAGGTTGYTISVTNPNPFSLNLATIVDDLPAGFTYRPGSTSGVTTDDPVVTDGGRHLEWTVPVAVPASGVSQLHFGVNAPTLPGDYFNRASA
ncbi:MAG TPA: hypothetical protein VNB24_06285, partial [Acidimicrobiales bacterium]|nr:hypothetical protein [Acidimicrobiales bacterium]